MKEVYLFGDQTANCRVLFGKLFARRDHVLLQAFLERVSEAIRSEDQKRAHHAGTVPKFSTIQELVDRYYGGDFRDAAVESALVCVCQLSHFIGFFEERTPSYISLDADVRIVGLCTGLLSATVVATADSLVTLIPLATEAVRLAFRIGAYLGKVASQVECSPIHQSWSSIVAVDEGPAQVALDDFHIQHDISPLNRIWISSSSTASVTVSGPPSIQKRLFEESEFFRSSRNSALPIYAPYHARHLHAMADIEQLITSSTKQTFGSLKLRVPICSSISGKPFQTSRSLDVLTEVLREIMVEPMKWDQVLENCTMTPTKTVAIFAFGPTNMTSSLASAYKAINATVAIDDPSSWPEVASSGTKFSKREADIAVVGFSGRFPDAADHELFWKILEQGLDVHRPVPPDRYPVDSHTDPTSKMKNTSHTPYGNFIENPGLFDARFFNMSPREATQTDPMQRLIMITGYEAMEMAGIVPGRTPSTQHDRIGTFYGQTSDDWREVNAAQDIDTYFISGGVRAFGPGRLNYFFKFSGPSFSIDTACSSSFAALHVAITSLRAGECDTAFTGGTNVLTNPDIFSGLSRGHFLSKTGSCKTWDNDADGYCRGDGVCTVILKRMEDALVDRDPILGVIRGIATNHSAQAVSITHPCAENQIFLFDKILKECNVDGKEVQYVEMHGTGTQAGDGIEMESVTTVFAPRNRRRRPDQPLYVGAVKSNIGHGEAVSGVSALIKVLLMFQKNKIPPHIGIKGQINKTFAPDLAERGVKIALETTPFPRPACGKRTVFINNFSAAGGNTALLMEDGPVPNPKPQPDPRPTHIVTVSAKSLAAFKKSFENLERYVSSHQHQNLADLAYTSTARRTHYAYRAAFSATSMSQLASKMTTARDQGRKPIYTVMPRMAFVYTGQGSQYTSMGYALYQTSSQFKCDIDEFNSIAMRLGLDSFMPLLESSVDVQHLPPAVVQLGMCCIQMALTRLWTTWGVSPSVVVGHSLGEYAALQAAGVLSVVDTIFLVGVRASLLEQKCAPESHAMLAVRLPVARVQQVITNHGASVEIACINGLSDTVMSGTVADIDLIAHAFADDGIKSTKLKLPFAFHSSQVDTILADFEKLAGTVTYHSPRVPIISPLLKTVVNTENVINGSYLSQHCRNTVDFAGALTNGVASAAISENHIWLEIGSHPICSNMIKSCLGVSVLPTMRRDEDPWTTISSTMAALYEAGKPLDWNSYHGQNEDLTCLSDLPAYGFELKNYWLQYTNDWLLYKGNYPLLAAPPADQSGIHSASPKSLSSSVQAIVSEDIGRNIATIVAESDLADPKLWPVIQGHLVNGSGMCPSSLYADQALTLAEYCFKLLRPDEQVHCNLGTMDVPAPLILQDREVPRSKVMRMSCKVDILAKKADFTVTSHKDGKETVHAKCTILFEDAELWKLEWNRQAYLIQSRIDVLKQKLELGHANKVGRSMAYKMFTALVDYSDAYQGMQSVVFDSTEFEATADVRFRCDAENENFSWSPYCIDSLCHLSGFTVNATVNGQDECFISHGWSSLRLLEHFEHDKRYQTYVKMQPVPGTKMRAGDVWIFNEKQEVVGFAGALRFQCIPRKLMNVMVPKPKDNVKSTQYVTSHVSEQAVAQLPRITIETPTHASKFKQASIQSKSHVQLRSDTNQFVAKAVAIVTTELGVDHSELADLTQWADLGVDSLMSLTITSRFREDLGLETDNSLFTDYPSVGALRKHFLTLSEHSSDSVVLTISNLTDSSTEKSSDSDDEMMESGITTPDPHYSLSKHNQSIGSTSAIAILNPPERETFEKIERIRYVISEEMEMALEDITDTTDLNSLGMDSLMALVVLGKLREDFGIELDSTTFIDNPSLGHLRKSLTRSSPTATATFSYGDKAIKTVKMTLDATSLNINIQPSATSVLLQGNPKTATKNLFLFPDGSGSATSYMSIPAIDNENLAVYGLNCPFMKNPTSFTCGIEGVSKLYLQEVMRRQPTGPYVLGGWSAGGVVAYEVTRQLFELAKHDSDRNLYVERLVLIDSPCPIRLEPLPARLHHFFDEIGLLGGATGKTPSWLLPHFEYSIKALTAYKPELKSMNGFTGPPTLLIWATEGVCGCPEDPRPAPQDDDPMSMKWLLDNRVDFGTNGWDKLLGAENCTMVKVMGNHFTMMRPPLAEKIGSYIRESLT